MRGICQKDNPEESVLLLLVLLCLIEMKSKMKSNRMQRLHSASAASHAWESMLCCASIDGRTCKELREARIFPSSSATSSTACPSCRRSEPLFFDKLPAPPRRSMRCSSGTYRLRSLEPFKQPKLAACALRLHHRCLPDAAAAAAAAASSTRQ